jgi:GNAT superfamily N-acetyltransferase
MGCDGDVDVKDTRIEVQALDALSEDQVAKIMALRSRIDFAVPDYAWTPMGQKKWRVLVWVGDELVSHVGILEREVRAGERPVRVGGVYTVMTAPEWRGKGLAGQALRVAAEYIAAELQADFGLLLCRDVMLPFYRDLGWRRVEESVVFDQPAGKTVSALNAMYLPLREAEWPAGTVDFCGPPW